jgi:hypothetical protein
VYVGNKAHGGRVNSGKGLYPAAYNSYGKDRVKKMSIFLTNLTLEQN